MSSWSYKVSTKFMWEIYKDATTTVLVDWSLPQLLWRDGIAASNQAVDENSWYVEGLAQGDCIIVCTFYRWNKVLE